MKLWINGKEVLLQPNSKVLIHASIEECREERRSPYNNGYYYDFRAIYKDPILFRKFERIS